MRRDAGFTLIELLVSLTLLGLLFVLLLGGLRFGTRAWERGTSTAAAGDTVRSAQSLLRAEIERACPRRTAARPEQPPRVAFTGDAVELGFLAPAPVSNGGRSCVPVTLRVRSQGAFQRLVLGTGAAESDLVSRAGAIAFAYLPANGPWRDSWAGQAYLPVLVRLRVTFPLGDGRVWPELFIAPRISGEADCTYDPATKSCRNS